ncbi:MAG: hypothetical protein JRH01_18415 [Deltaproteobacteria bacterium]|nr:hypothetical protein [Deltaproteobacteria bacterium]MBW2395952.1 hypothetical protein [Deltaproteobacteria bacterium]
MEWEPGNEKESVPVALGRLAIMALPSLAGCAAVIAAYWLVLSTLFPDSRVTLASFTLGFFAFTVLLNLKQLILPDATLRALRRRGRNSRPLDGKVCAVEGTLVALGEPVLSPLENEECLVYEAQIFRYVQMNEGTNRTWDFLSHGHRPAAVSTPLGEVQILGFPDLSHVPVWELEADDVRDHAASWIAETEFSAKPGFRDAPGLVRDLLDNDAPEGLRNLSEPGAELLPDHRFEEKLVRAGDPVTAVGKYDALRSALVPQGASGVEIYAGTIDDAIGDERYDRIRSLVIATVVCVIVHGFASQAIP